MRFFAHAKTQNIIFAADFGGNFSFRSLAYRMRGRAEAARRAHNPEVGGSNPPPATNTNRKAGQSPAFSVKGRRLKLA